MRTVIKGDEVCHLWAHQSQEHARNSGDTQSFRGRWLYSYRAPIGYIADLPGGGQAAILSTRKYSVTTTSHQYDARHATSHMTRFYVPDLTGMAWTPERQRESLVSYLDGLAEDASGGRNRISRAKRFEKWRSAAWRANHFCAAFNLEPFHVPESADVEKVLAELRARREEQEKAQAEKRRKEHEALEQKAKANLQGWIDGESMDWRSLGTMRYLDSAYMRIEGDEIATTMGARVPAEHVRRLAPIIVGIIRAGRTWPPTDGDTRIIRFGHYHLDRIEADGTVVVGCHRFSRAEIERVAKLLEVQPAELVAD